MTKQFNPFPKRSIVTDVPAERRFYSRNYPNPFNPSTRIEFSVPVAGDVSVKIYNMRGELVRRLVSEFMRPSDHVVREWNGTDDDGQAVASGVYFYDTRVGEYSKIRKMALIR